jgi:hypothetical protein
LPSRIGSLGAKLMQPIADRIASGSHALQVRHQELNRDNLARIQGVHAFRNADKTLSAGHGLQTALRSVEANREFPFEILENLR